jgi:hypothetical protein
MDGAAHPTERMTRRVLAVCASPLRKPSTQALYASCEGTRRPATPSGGFGRRNVSERGAHGGETAPARDERSNPNARWVRRPSIPTFHSMRGAQRRPGLRRGTRRSLGVKQGSRRCA